MAGPGARSVALAIGDGTGLAVLARAIAPVGADAGGDAGFVGDGEVLGHQLLFSLIAVADEDAAEAGDLEAGDAIDGDAVNDELQRLGGVGLEDFAGGEFDGLLAALAEECAVLDFETEGEEELVPRSRLAVDVDDRVAGVVDVDVGTLFVVFIGDEFGRAEIEAFATDVEGKIGVFVDALAEGIGGGANAQGGCGRITIISSGNDDSPGDTGGGKKDRARDGPLAAESAEGAVEGVSHAEDSTDRRRAAPGCSARNVPSVADAREERLDRVFPDRAPTGWWKLARAHGSVVKMTYRELSSDEVELVLEKERVVRISFSADGDSYVVPVFFAWHEGALCGLTTPGRKTRMGERNPVVGFQVDSTVTTGPWEWASVVGQGMFEQVPDPMESGLFAAKLWARMGDAPDWAGAMLRARFDELGIYPWRIIPATMLGRAHGRE